jgi:heme exporter protein A
VQTSILQLDKITISRANTPVLSSFSLTINPSEIHWILGPNGVGKTSLLKASAGLLALEEGNILWEGKPISQIRAEQSAAIHYIGHTNGIKLALTVEENLKLAAAVSGFPTRTSLSEAIKKVGLQQKHDVLCRELSAGQQRRVALARLYYLSAKLWILDEPFTAMDDEGSQLISSLFIEHLAKSGAIMASTHRLPTDFNPQEGQYFITLQKKAEAK